MSYLQYGGLNTELLYNMKLLSITLIFNTDRAVFFDTALRVLRSVTEVTSLFLQPNRPAFFYIFKQKILDGFFRVI